jgi:iron complex outermembrane receptor protein
MAYQFARVAVLAIVLAAPVVLTDEAAAQEETAKPSPALEEILVTATRRGETALQTTPVTVTALNSELVDQLIPHDLGDIAIMAPNFSAARATGFNAAAFAIRGVSHTDIIVYHDAPVGVAIDDFVIPSVQTQLLEMFDIESVEVLRGPQGTLFGKNTTGGVVNVRTKRPNLEEVGVEGRFLYGSFGRKEVRASVNVPLLQDQLGLRISGLYQKSDGYYENGKVSNSVVGLVRGDGGDEGGDDVISGRVKLLWEPTEDFRALFQYETIQDDADSPPAINETPDDPRLAWFNLGFTGVNKSDPLDDAGISNRDDLGLDITRGHRVDVDGYYLNIDWDIGDLSLASVTGYREQQSRLPNTYTGEAFPSLFDATRDDDRETFQQEVRVASSFDGPVNFVAGGFYQTNDTEFCVLQFLGFLDIFALPPSALGVTGLAADNNNFNPSVLCNKQDATSWAAFGDVTFDVNERLSIGAGGRFTVEDKEWKARHQVFIQLLPGPDACLTGVADPTFTIDILGDPLRAANFGRFPCGVVQNDDDWDEFTWRANVSYQFTDDIFGYFIGARGFRSGGYNDQVGTAGAGGPFPIPLEFQQPYDPETADSFELGVKSSWLDNRLQVNANAFYVQYDDAQRQIVAAVQVAPGIVFEETRFFNAAEVEVAGFELEWTALLSDWLPDSVPGDLLLRGNLGYLDTEYDTFEIDTDFDGMVDLDLSNRDVERSPEWQFMVDLTYDHPLRDWGDLSWNFNLSYEDDQTNIYSPLGEALDTVLEDKTLLNLSATFTDRSERYMVRVFAKNLTDEIYRTAAQPVGGLWTFALYGRPRTFGIEIGASF